MATLREAIKAKLEADATLVALVPGGFYYRADINRTDTPAAYDGRGRLKVCGVLTMSTDAMEFPGLRDMDVSRAFFFIYYYDDPAQDYVNIDDAVARTRTVLEGQTASVEAGSVYEFVHADDSPDLYDDVLGANGRYSRYYAIIKRS